MVIFFFDLFYSRENMWILYQSIYYNDSQMLEKVICFLKVLAQTRTISS